VKRHGAYFTGMKAWTLVAQGDPHRAFALLDHAVPVPTAQQVRIRVEGFGLNYADVMAMKGLYRDAPPVPAVIGYEVVGRVDEVGAAVPQDLLGRRVVAMTRFGGYAEVACTDHRACAIVPDDMPLGEAAALATQGATAWMMARMLCPLFKGQRVLVHSAAGGVGHLLVQLALASVCEVYAVAGGPLKMEFLRRLGAQHVIDRRSGPYQEGVARALSGDRLDVSFNPVAGSTFRRDMRLLGAGGRLVLYGGAERGALGPFGTLRFVWRMGLVVPILLMMRSRSLIGVNMLHLSDHRPALVAQAMQGAVEDHRNGVLRPHVHGVYEAVHLIDAMMALASGHTMGKVVVGW
jgi:NADPH2:quinone reductase